MNDAPPNAQSIFLEAIEKRSPEELRDFLDQACGDNAALRSRVEKLLRAHQDAGSFFGGSASDAETAILPAGEGPGAVIGPYKLLQEIGHGGMGLVFMAEQTSPVNRMVALKIIKPGMDTRQVIARFEAERQALAMMNHPNIANVLGAGTTGNGHPYFVMELVKGIPITQYCDEHHLGPRQRLELFIPVCRAIQHAHQKGIIHRDIKPSNILIAEYDDRAVPKIIDFGIAKAVDHRLTEKTLFTQFGQVVGTPEYMSPEQAKLNQLDIDTRTDIYSLGVLLYELLTGETPFDRERLRSAALDELLRIIREEEPLKPSTRLSSGGSSPAVASNRDTEPARLTAIVRGELDWIVMKALEKDRARRYGTASGFAEDVESYLGNQPVRACPPSYIYRLRKTVSRNKALLATGTLITLTLLAATIGSSIFALWAIRESRDKDVALTRAEANEQQTLEAKGTLERENYRLVMGLAFGAFRDGDLDRLHELLAEARGVWSNQGQMPFEWRLLDRQLRARREPVDSKKYESPIRSLAAIGNNRLFIVLRDGRLVSRDLESHKDEIVTIDPSAATHWASTNVVCGGANTEMIVAGGRLEDGSGAVAVGYPTRAEETQLRIHFVCDAPVASLAIDEESGAVLVGTGDGQVIACDVTSSQELWRDTFAPPDAEDRTMRPQGPVVIAAACGMVVAAINNTMTVKYWEARSGEDAGTYTSRYVVRDIKVSPDGRRALLSQPTGLAMTALDVKRQPTLEAKVPHRANLTAVSPDGGQIAAADSFGGVRLLNSETLRQSARIRQMRGVNMVSALTYSRDGNSLYVGDKLGGLAIWDVQRMEPPAHRSAMGKTALQYLAVQAFGDQVVMRGDEPGVVQLFNLESGIVRRLGKNSPSVNGVAISGDGHRVATAESGGETSLVALWDVDSSQVINQVTVGRLSENKLGYAAVHNVAFDPNDPTKIAACGNGHVAIWNTATDQVIKLAGYKHDRVFLTLTFSPDGQYLVAGGGRWEYYAIGEFGTTLVWDMHQLPNIDPVHHITHERIVYSVDFAPDGEEFASGGLDTHVKLCRVADWSETTISNQYSWLTGLAYTPCGNRLVTARPSGDVTFWDRSERKLIGTMQLDEGIRRVAVSPRGLLTASSEGYIRFWEAAPERIRTRQE